ncbi:hypothetical protein B0H19DRAFT_1365350 [Mycena capillaripes]|nr:hypothetical protein B0H19DRAFT_1365350 [Mycena capillaripes]
MPSSPDLFLKWILPPKLLGIIGDISGCEVARIALNEVIIGEILKGWRIGHSIRTLEAAADRAEISDNLLSVGLNMEASSPDRLEFSWLAPDIYLRITTHLDDERNMKKGILELADELTVNHRPGSRNRIKSTAALQFLPSFFATSPSTPGITAIGSLAFYCLDRPMNTIHPDHFLHKVPFDVLELIAVKYLCPSDVESLCAAVPPFQQAAASVLRFPHIEYYRFVEVLEDDAENKNKNGLTSKAFSTMTQRSLGSVIVVGEGTDSFGFLLQVGDSVKKVKWKVDQSRLYRRSRYYHVHYNHCDSYPENLGIKVAVEVPRDEEACKTWIEKLCQALDYHFEQKKDRVDSPGGKYGYRITTERPENQAENNRRIEWVYEIDVDHEVFLGESETYQFCQRGSTLRRRLIALANFGRLNQTGLMLNVGNMRKNFVANILESEAIRRSHNSKKVLLHRLYGVMVTHISRYGGA